MKPSSLLFGSRSLLFLIATLSCAAWSLTNATAAEVVRTFRETDETFANPGQG